MQGLTLCDFYDWGTVFDFAAKHGEHGCKCGEQGLLADISKPHPDDLRRGAVACGQMLEVLVHRDDNETVRLGKIPDLGVGHRCKTVLTHMVSLQAVPGKNAASASGNWLSTRNFKQRAEPGGHFARPRS